MFEELDLDDDLTWRGSSELGYKEPTSYSTVSHSQRVEGKDI